MLEPRKFPTTDGNDYHETYKYLIDRHETCTSDRAWIFILHDKTVVDTPRCFDNFRYGAEIMQCVKDIGWFPVESATVNSEAILAIEDQMNGPVFWKG